MKTKVTGETKQSESNESLEVEVGEEIKQSSKRLETLSELTALDQELGLYGEIGNT
ncbi:hypothetical protein VCHA53O466_140167 [Vibrio chagasii]|nr:hypothetical protein VCHA53O466_140167 [Vibrio chagasii]